MEEINKKRKVWRCGLCAAKYMRIGKCFIKHYAKIHKEWDKPLKIVKIDYADEVHIYGQI